MPHTPLNNPFLSIFMRNWNKYDDSPNFLQDILHSLPQNLFKTAWIRPPGGLVHLWNCPTMYSSLFSGPSLRKLEGIVTWGVPSSRYVGSAARKRFLDDWFIRAAHGNRREPSSLSTGGGNFFIGNWEVVWTGYANCSLSLWPLTIDSFIVGQKQAIWLFTTSVNPKLGVAGFCQGPWERDGKYWSKGTRWKREIRLLNYSAVPLMITKGESSSFEGWNCVSPLCSPIWGRVTGTRMSNRYICHYLSDK